MPIPSVCIVGPGVVGQATGKVFVQKGIRVGFLGVVREQIEELKSQGFNAFTKDEIYNGNYDYDITMLTVPTPTVKGKIDLSFIKSAAMELGKRLRYFRKYHVVVVKSTVPPGTTENVVIPILERFSGKKVGPDFGVCMNPEYLRAKTSFEDTLNPWIILFGAFDKKSGDMLEMLYKNKFDCPIHRCKIQEAEMQKYVHNLFNATKITFHNEMRQIANNLGIDANKIFMYSAISCEGMWNPEYGIKDHGPFSGACLPKDTQAFHGWAQMNGFDTTLLRTVIKVNNKHIRKLGVPKSKKYEEKPL